MPEDAQVGVDLVDNAGTAQLDGNQRAVQQPRPVDLGNGRRTDRMRVKLGTHALDRHTQRRRQHGRKLPGRNRRHPGLQFFKLGNPFRRKHVHPGGHDLPELDEGRPQILQCPAYAHRRWHICVRAGQGAAEPFNAFFDRTRQLQPLGELSQSVPKQDGGNLAQARQIAHGDKGLFQHEVCEWIRFPQYISCTCCLYSRGWVDYIRHP